MEKFSLREFKKINASVHFGNYCVDQPFYDTEDFDGAEVLCKFIKENPKLVKRILQGKKNGL